MLKVLVDLLTPFFESLGVSATDVDHYVNMLSGYIYAILITLVLMAAVMVAAHFVAKKERGMWFVLQQEFHGC